MPPFPQDSNVRVRLDYGTDGLEVDLPDERITVIEPMPRPAVPDARATLLHALRNPLERAPLREVVQAGKKIAISDIRSSPYYFARAGFKKLGLDDRQVALATTGGTSNSFAALASNQVAGAVLSPPFDDKAVSLGYKKFLFLGDLVDIPYVGLFTSQAEILMSITRSTRAL